MSMMLCLDCGRNVDTKSGWGLEGTWKDLDYICPDCTEMRENYREACRMEEEQDKLLTNSNANMRKN